MLLRRVCDSLAGFLFPALTTMTRISFVALPASVLASCCFSPQILLLPSTTQQAPKSIAVIPSSSLIDLADSAPPRCCTRKGKLHHTLLPWLPLPFTAITSQSRPQWLWALLPQQPLLPAITRAWAVLQADNAFIY